MGKKAAIPENVDDDDALDMFADNLDGDAKKAEETKAPTKEKEDPMLDEVSWEFKWKTDDAELHGPHTSQKMLDWQVGIFSFGFVSTLHFFRWVICHLDLSQFHILFSFRSLASSMLAFLSEKLGLRSSGIPRGLTLSSMSSSTHLTSWM